MPKTGQNIFASRLFADSEPSSQSGYDLNSRGLFASQTAARQVALDAGSAGGAKLTHALALDGIGDLKPPVLLPAFLITTDSVPDAPDTAGSTNPAIVVTGPGVTTPIVSSIDTIGDQDFYKVTLTAGTTYEFGMYNYTGGPNAVESPIPIWSFTRPTARPWW